MEQPHTGVCSILEASSQASGATCDAGFTWMILPRHGRRPLGFIGRELLRVDTKRMAVLGLSEMWFDIRIHELAQCGYVAALRHVRSDDGLANWQDAFFASDAATLVSALRDHDFALGHRTAFRSNLDHAVLQALMRRVFASAIAT